MKRLLHATPALLAVCLFVLPASSAVPTGYLDSAGCDVIQGWAQDPDVPTSPIDVHVYFGAPAGTPNTPATATTAANYRGDLCAAIGSCEHGFAVRSPLSMHDGLTRDVFAYGIDTGGEGNPVLGGSPRSLACAPAVQPGVQPGVRRPITNVPAFDAWRFSSFWDLLPLPGADADALPEGPPLPDKPEVVRADDGSPEVWLLDGGIRRAISAEAAAAWRIDITKAEATPAADVLSYPEGTPLRARPVLFIRGGLYIVDDAQTVVPAPATSSAASTGAWGEGGAGGAGGAGQDQGTVSGFCAVSAPGEETPFSYLGMFLPLIAVFASRRRARPFC